MLLRIIKAELIPISTTLERTELVRTSIKSNGLKKKKTKPCCFYHSSVLSITWRGILK